MTLVVPLVGSPAVEATAGSCRSPVSPRWPLSPLPRAEGRWSVCLSRGWAGNEAPARHWGFPSGQKGHGPCPPCLLGPRNINHMCTYVWTHAHTHAQREKGAVLGRQCGRLEVEGGHLGVPSGFTFLFKVAYLTAARQAPRER